MKYKIKIFLMVILGLSLFLPSVLSISISEYYDGLGDDNAEIYDYTWRAQTFTIGTVGYNMLINITNISLYLARSQATDMGLLTIYLQSTIGDNPSGVNLSSGTINTTALGSGAANIAWHNCSMQGYDLMPGVKYAIVIKPDPSKTDSFPNYIMWQRNTTDASYAGGWGFVSDNAGSVWDSQSNTDFMFRLYGNYSFFNIISNDTTDIYTTNATLNGYLIVNNTMDCTVRFQYGPTIAYGTNTSNQTISSNQSVTQIITSLTPGTLYHCRIYAENDTNISYGADKTFLTRPDKPVNIFANNTDVSNSINLSWDKGTGANKTYIERKTTETPWAIGEGTLVYNGTGTSNSTYYTVNLSYGWNNVYFPSYIFTQNSSIASNNSVVSFLENSTIYDETNSVFYDPGTGLTSWVKGLDPIFITLHYITYNPVNPYQISINDNCTLSLLLDNITGTSNYHTEGGLELGYTYYYQFWSYANWSSTPTYWFSGNYSSANATILGYPVVTTNTSTNIEENNATLNGYLTSNGGETCTVRFQYGTTTAYGTNTSNQTKTTGETFSANILGLNPGTLYHYRAVANNTFGTTNGSDKMLLTKPEAPTSLTFTFINNTAINLSWTKGTGANNTVIIWKTTGMPTDISDGTIVYNSTGNYYITNISTGTNYYFRTWSFSYYNFAPSPSYSQFSDNYTDFTTGGIHINCYDETTLANLTFNVSIVNSDGSQVYNAWGCTNTKTINASLCPQGVVSVFISSNGYTTRSYSLNIETNIFYLLNAYLPKTDTTVVTNVSRLYLIRVTNDVGYALNDVLVKILGYSNTSGNYEIMSSGYTDGAGEITFNLYPNVNYLVNLSKTGYITSSTPYTPDPVFYGLFYPKILRLFPTTYTPGEYTFFSQNIVMYGNMSTTSGYIGTVSFFYQDLNSSTTNIMVYLYDTSANNSLANSSSSTNDVYSVSYTGINTTHSYKIVVWYNNTATFADTVCPGPHIIFVQAIATYTEYPAKNLNDMVTKVVGPFIINGIVVPWGDIGIMVIAIIFMGIFSLISIGVGLITGGFTIGLFQGLFQYWHFTDTIQPALLACIPILIIAGVIYMMTKYSSDEVL